MRAWLFAAILAVGAAHAEPILPKSYGTTTDADSILFRFEFDRPFDLTSGDLFQVWTVAGYDVYDAALAQMQAEDGSILYLENAVAIRRIIDPSAPPVSMLSFREPEFGIDKVQVVNLTSFAPGTQDNGSNDRGGWGQINSYQNYAILGSTLFVDIPFAALGMGPNLTYFFETYQDGGGSAGPDGLIRQWVGKSGLDYSEPFEVPLLAPIPEPSTYALMFAGLAAVGFVAKRRRSVISA